MTKKKRTWKYWFGRTILVILLLGLIWLVNLIWFRPFNIRLFYDKAFLEIAIENPEVVTSLGIPVLYDMTKDELTDVSDAKLWEEFENTRKNLETLKSYDFESQSKDNQLNTKIMQWYLESQVEAEPYFYHDYPVNQLFGVQSNLPSFMESAHKLLDKSDVEAYIARLSKFDTKFDQVLEGLKLREQKGIIPPKFVIERVLEEMKGFTGQNGVEKINLELNPGPVRENILYTNFESKVALIDELSAEEKESYKQQVEEEVRTTVFDAYQKLIDFLEDLENVNKMF